MTIISSILNFNRKETNGEGTMLIHRDTFHPDGDIAHGPRARVR